MTTHHETARALLRSVQAMITTALQPFDEQARRTAGLLAHTIVRLERLEARDPDSDAEHGLAGRVSLLEAQRWTAETAHTLEAKLAAHGKDLAQLEDRVREIDTEQRAATRRNEAELFARVAALATRVDQLECGRAGPRVDDPDRLATGMVDAMRERLPVDIGGGRIREGVEVSPGRIQVQLEPEDVQQLGPMNAPRRGPPPGVPDPTTLEIERQTMERAEMAKQLEHARALLSIERKEHEEKQTALLLRLEASGRSHAAAQEGLKAQERMIDNRDATIREMRNEAKQRTAKLGESTDMIDKIATACGVQPLGSREQNAAKVLEWIDAAKHVLEQLQEKIRFREMTTSPHEADLERKLQEAQRAVKEARDAAVVSHREAIEHREARSKAEHDATELRDEIKRRAGEHTVQVETITAQIERLIDQRTSTENMLADAKHDLAEAIKANIKLGNERDEAITRAKAHSATIAEFANKCRALEEQALGRDKLAARRLHTFEQLQDRIRTVADEKFGPFPVQSADDALGAIEQGAFFQSMDVQAGIRLFDAIGGPDGGIDGVWGMSDVREARKAYDAERKRVQAMREVGMARFYGKSEPDPDDCQAGTCDCPSGPSYSIAHKEGCPVGADDIPF